MKPATFFRWQHDQAPGWLAACAMALTLSAYTIGLPPAQAATALAQTSPSATAAPKERKVAKPAASRPTWNQLSAEQQLATRNLGIDTNLLERLQKLQLTGAVSEVQVLSQRSQVNEGEAKLQTLKADRLRQSALFNQQIQALNGDLADLRSRLTESRVNNRYQLIRSPVNGVVFDLKPTGPGFVGQGSEPLMKIVPFNALKATVEVDSSKIGFVRTGQTVDISIDSFPSSDFGVVEGQIKRIGSDALPPDQLKQTYRFPVEVQLDSQQLRLKSGRALPLQVGMSLTANIKLRKVTYLQLMLSTFKDKTDSLREI